MSLYITIASSLPNGALPMVFDHIQAYLPLNPMSANVPFIKEKIAAAGQKLPDDFRLRKSNANQNKNRRRK